MTFSPSKALGLVIGLSALGLSLTLDALALALIGTQDFGWLTFALASWVTVTVPVMVWLGYRCLGLLTARYQLLENALIVEWGARREVIPLSAIKAVQLGIGLGGAPLRMRGLHWPGCFAGLAEQPELGEAECWATTLGVNGLVLIAYPNGWLILSPSDPSAFLEMLNEAREANLPTTLQADSVWPEWGLARDRVAVPLIVVAGLAWLALVGYLAAIFPQLPPEIALRFGADGLPDRFGPPTGLLILPLIGASTWLVNALLGTWFYRLTTHRPAAYLLFGTAVFVQALVWLATIGLLTAGRPT